MPIKFHLMRAHPLPRSTIFHQIVILIVLFLRLMEVCLKEFCFCYPFEFVNCFYFIQDPRTSNLNHAHKASMSAGSQSSFVTPSNYFHQSHPLQPFAAASFTNPVHQSSNGTNSYSHSKSIWIFFCQNN